MSRFAWRREQEMTGRERAAWVAWQLCEGTHLTVEEAAEATGLSRKGAWKLLQDISRVVPIYSSQYGRVWRKCDLDELEEGEGSGASF